jgi:copper(I)-binding protein
VRLIGLCLALLVAGPAAAQKAGPATLTVQDAWARPTASAQGNGVAYATLRNTGSAPVRVTGVRSPVARVAELHSTSISAEGVAQMRPVQAIEIPPGGEARLTPAGMHVMLIGLTQKLAAGESFPLTLVLEQGGEVEAQVSVQSRPAGSGEQMDHSGHHAQ